MGNPMFNEIYIIYVAVTRYKKKNRVASKMALKYQPK